MKNGKGGRSLNTEACGSDTRDVTIANGDEQFKAHETVNKMKNGKGGRTLNTEACGSNTRDVTIANDDEQIKAHETVYK